MLHAADARKLMELDTTVQCELDFIDTLIKSVAQSGSHETVYYINNYDVAQRILGVLQDHGFIVESFDSRNSTKLGISW